MTQSFNAAAEECLRSLLAQIEEQTDAIDADLLDGVLTLELPDGNQIILNRQLATEQIWLASSDGPARFDWRGGSWLDERGGKALGIHLAEILSHRLGHPILLQA
ncbi:MAG: iron donor protein CyaY [Acidithiobacillus sp.]|nr:iron donor protein CyaY [Acidithiobacillus sp.]